MLTDENLLEAERDRLLRYVRAIFALDVDLDNDAVEAGEQFAAQIEELNAARQDLIDHGDVECAP